MTQHLKQILSLMLAFAPWVAFLILAGPSIPRLKTAVIVSALITLVMWIWKLHKGIILLAGAIFFTWALIAVVWIQHMWTIRHLGVLSNATLALGTFISILMKRPFTLGYAKKREGPEDREDATFFRTNYIITGFWGVIFVINTTLNYFKVSTIVSYAFLFLAILFSTFYPELVKKYKGKLI